jgi:hypothetical protein
MVSVTMLSMLALLTSLRQWATRMVKNLKRIEKAWFPVSQFPRTAAF